MTDKKIESEIELVLLLNFLTLEHMASQEICDHIQLSTMKTVIHMQWSNIGLLIFIGRRVPLKMNHNLDGL